jgi:hypothetical protein
VNRRSRCRVHELAEDATAVRPELGMAAQMQFYAKYRL